MLYLCPRYNYRRVKNEKDHAMGDDRRPHK